MLRHHMIMTALGGLLACSDPGDALRSDPLGARDEPLYSALVYGRVLNRDGSPAVNVLVWLVGSERNASCRAAPDPWLEATTDVEGRYRLWAYATTTEPRQVCVELLAQAGVRTPPVVVSQTPARPEFRINPPYDSTRLDGVIP